MPRSVSSVSTKTPYARVIAHPDVKALPKRRLTKQHTSFNPAAVQRQIQAVAEQLLTLATAKAGPVAKPRLATLPQADLPDEATKRRSRTS